MGLKQGCSREAENLASTSMFGKSYGKLGESERPRKIRVHRPLSLVLTATAKKPRVLHGDEWQPVA